MQWGWNIFNMYSNCRNVYENLENTFSTWMNVVKTPLQSQKQLPCTVVSVSVTLHEKHKLRLAKTGQSYLIGYWSLFDFLWRSIANKYQHITNCMHTCPNSCIHWKYIHTLSLACRIKKTADHTRTDDRLLFGWEQISYGFIFLCSFVKGLNMALKVVNQYLAWVGQWEISFPVFVCFQRGVPQLSWEGPDCPG